MKKNLLSMVLASCALVPVFSSLQAESLTFQENIRVIKSEPIYRSVTTRTPIQECWDEQVPVAYNQNDDAASNVGALIGGIAGGVLGHQVGGGTGKTAATVGGAIIGTLVGKNMGQSEGGNDPRHSYRIEKRCVTKYDERAEEKFVGYKNIAHYKGNTVVKYSDMQLDEIPIIITVSY